MPAFGAWGFADIYKELFPQGEAAYPHRRRVSHACSLYHHEESRYAAFDWGLLTATQQVVTTTELVSQMPSLPSGTRPAQTHTKNHIASLRNILHWINR